MSKKITKPEELSERIHKICELLREELVPQILPEYLTKRLIPDNKVFNFGFTGLKRSQEDLFRWVGQILVAISVPGKPGRENKDGYAFWYANFPVEGGSYCSPGGLFVLGKDRLVLTDNTTNQELKDELTKIFIWLAKQLVICY
jgi:hypothetical protein